ncbi:DNA repair protein RadC [Pedobacter psychrotolerans]|uniref:DNA repair protein n=1 Tax=Pedobacter psychrotolerans TaxID=1843235 RepID=A0A4R2H4Z9_9SPHI|nr:JAB domain-containing protein [Pedobacter psychrotolerans]TCO20771.1 DNA repair protein RadC [Pedobacter psychrotolerans]GGE67971.1 DNA repair protein [Pedobacter psychrotolerans]
MVQEQNPFKVAEVEVSYKSNYNITERPKINSSQDAYRILMQYWQLGRIELLEEFKVILLNTSNRVLGIVDISVGGVQGTLADPKIIFSVALKTSSSKIILAHNHPSGNLNPSDADKRLTEKLKDGGKLLDIEVCDHLIITKHNYYGFADNCLI